MNPVERLVMKKQISLFRYLVSVFIFASLGLFAAFGQDSRSSFNEVLGVSSNGFRPLIAIYSDSKIAGKAPPTILVSLQSLAVTNINRGYLKSPKFPWGEIELNDSLGRFVETKRKSEAFPTNILLSKLPRDWKGSMEGRLSFQTNSTTLLGFFSLREEFNITNSGNFELTIKPKLYKFSADKKSVDRIELLPVKVLIKLE